MAQWLKIIEIIDTKLTNFILTVNPWELRHRCRISAVLDDAKAS